MGPSSSANATNGEPARKSSRHRVPPRLVHWGVDSFYAGLLAVMPVYAITRVLVDPKTRSRWRAYLRDMPQRFGARAPRRGDRPCVWVHGVSVGEVKAAARLVEEIEETVPDVEVIVSVTTDTGKRVAEKRYPGHRVEFYPPDLSWVVHDAIGALRPDLMVLVESEFWPNFLFAAQQRSLPVVLVNGRMSQRSADRFGLLGGLSRTLLESIERICVQMPLYADRFLQLGVEPSRLHVTGNMKLDNIPIKPDDGRARIFGRLFGAGQGLPIVVAGSTHPGEERAVVGMHHRLCASGQPFRLVVVPRHPARADSVEGEIRRRGGRALRRSRMDDAAGPDPRDVILLDTIGELELAYAVADVAFVGGTLVPHGGQNMMEPASLGRPVVVGPYVDNFRGEVEMLLHADALVLASDARGVEETIGRFLREPDTAAAYGQRAREAIERSKGATERTLAILRPLLQKLVR